MTKCVAYARVSSKEQERDGYSIPAQQKLLREYATDNGLKIVHEYVDVETAKTTGRTGFGEMVAFLNMPKQDCRIILVEKTDRLYRSIKDWVTLDVDDLDVEVHFAKENAILSRNSRSSEKFIHGIKVLQAKNYCDNLSEEVRKGMREKAEQGEWPNKAPLGYLNNKETHQLDVDRERAPIIAQLFELYSTEQHSITSLHQRSKELGLRYRGSGQHCSRSNIDRIIRNPIYTGRFVWKGRTYQGVHEPIISEKLFGEVQALLKRDGKSKQTTRAFAFKGLLTCGYCGCSITAEIKKGKYIYYRCTNGKGKCEQPYVREEKLADALAEVVDRIRITPDQADDIRKALKASLETEREFRSSEVARLRREHAKLQQRLEQTYLDKIEGRIDTEFWRKTHDRWTEEQNLVSVRMAELSQANRNYYEQGVRFLELAQTASDQYLEQPAEEQAKLLRLLLSNCTIKGVSLCPTYNEPFNLLVEGLDSNKKLGYRDSNPDSTVQSRVPYHWTISQCLLTAYVSLIG